MLLVLVLTIVHDASQVYDNYLNGMNPQDNSDDMTVYGNYVSKPADPRL